LPYQPVEAKGDDEGEDSSEVGQRQAHTCWVTDDDVVEKLAQDDDVKSGQAVDLVRDIDGRTVLELEDALDPRAQGKRPRALLIEDHEGDDDCLGTQTDALEEQRNGEEEAEEHETGQKAGLGAVLRHGEGGDKKDRHGREARGDVSSGRRAKGRDILVGEGCVVGVKHQQGHDPENEGALEQVVGVVRVHDLAEVGPNVPGGSEYQHEFCEMRAVGIFGKVIAEVGDDGDV
jgi:hypothetical protein